MAKSPETLTLSPTKVDTFFGCKRLFYYKYIAEIPVAENKFFLIGNVAHAALENFHKILLVDEERDWKELLSEQFKKAAEKYRVFSKIRDGLIRKSDLIDIKFMLKNYLKYLNSSEEFPSAVSVEKLAKIVLDKDIVIWLKADRIDTLDGNGSFKVVDYKSGKPASQKDELASVQIPSYGMLVQQEFGKTKTILGEYIYLRYADSAKGIHAHEISEELIEKAKNKYRRVKQHLTKGGAYSQNFKYKYCNFCDYKRRCLQEEDDEL